MRVSPGTPQTDAMMLGRLRNPAKVDPFALSLEDPGHDCGLSSAGMR